MSGWIKFDKDMVDDPRLMAAASRLLERYQVSVRTGSNGFVDLSKGDAVRYAVNALRGALVTLWRYADEHVRDDDTVTCTVTEIDALVGIDGFCDVMPASWLVTGDDGRSVTLPGYCAKNALSYRRKKSNKSAERQKRYRERLKEQRERNVTGNETGTDSVSRGGDQDQDQDLLRINPAPHSRRGGDERKPRTRKRTPPFDPATVAGLDIGAWNAWVQYRAERKPAIKPVSMQSLAEALAGFGAQQAAVVRHSKANGYQGLVSPKPNGHGGRGPDPADAEREGLQKLRDRRKAIPALHDFRDPLPGETSKQYRAAQDAAFEAHQDAKHKPRAVEARAVRERSRSSATFSAGGANREVPGKAQRAVHRIRWLGDPSRWQRVACVLDRLSPRCARQALPCSAARARRRGRGSGLAQVHAAV